MNREDLRKLFTPQHLHQEKLGRILIMADAAHSIGSKYKGQAVGKLADLTVISLHAVKNITSAEGGVVLFNLPAPFQNEEEYRNQRLFVGQKGNLLRSLCYKAGIDFDSCSKLTLVEDEYLPELDNNWMFKQRFYQKRNPSSNP